MDCNGPSAGAARRIKEQRAFATVLNRFAADINGMIEEGLVARYLTN
jgi:hypothetical protein